MALIDLTKRQLESLSNDLHFSDMPVFDGSADNVFELA